MAKVTHTFETEIKELLDIMIHSLYSHKEIFLRELISNASDAIDKLKFECLTRPELVRDGIPFEIRLIPDTDKKTLTIRDNGIGMTFDEVKKYIGTIAHSGTRKFGQLSQEVKNQPDLIGQFGVGFYSAFMVADRVTLHTQKAGSHDGVLWESSGDGNYSIDQIPHPYGHGTSITLHLKPQAQDEESEKNQEVGGQMSDHQDFLDEWTLKGLVKKYSDFIAHPIIMRVTKQEPKKDDKGEAIKGEYESVLSDETLNSQKALWLKAPSEIKEEEYKEFYHHLCHEWSDPIKTIHYRAEGTMEFTALLYLPSKQPYNYMYKEYTHGLDLYVKRVFIMHECKELVPSYLRFVKGLVDSSDLSLNISREMIQQDRQVGQIRNSLTAKILSLLQEMLTRSRSEYEKFWMEFGETLKEGIPMDHANKEKLLGISLFHTTNGPEVTTLKEYKGRMKEGQKAIYYITGDSLDYIKKSPFLEKAQQKGYEVLLLNDVVDEWVATSITEFDKTPFQNITSDQVDLESEDEKKAQEESIKEAQTKFEPLLKTIKTVLESEIKDVRLSSRLTDSPACLVTSSSDPSKRMEKILSGLGQNIPKSKRILELNPSHPIFDKMLESDEEHKKEWSEIIYNQALLAEGSPLPDPMKFSKQISNLMMKV